MKLYETILHPYRFKKTLNNQTWGGQIEWSECQDAIAKMLSGAAVGKGLNAPWYKGWKNVRDRGNVQGLHEVLIVYYDLCLWEMKFNSRFYMLDNYDSIRFYLWRQFFLLRSKANRQRRACSLDSCLSCSFLDSTVDSDACGQLAGLSWWCGICALHLGSVSFFWL